MTKVNLNEPYNKHRCEVFQFLSFYEDHLEKGPFSSLCAVHKKVNIKQGIECKGSHSSSIRVSIATKD